MTPVISLRNNQNILRISPLWEIETGNTVHVAKDGDCLLKGVRSRPASFVFRPRAVSQHFIFNEFLPPAIIERERTVIETQGHNCTGNETFAGILSRRSISLVCNSQSTAKRLVLSCCKYNKTPRWNSFQLPPSRGGRVVPGLFRNGTSPAF